MNKKTPLLMTVLSRFNDNVENKHGSTINRSVIYH